MRFLACTCAVVMASACSQGAGDDFPVIGGGGAGLGYGQGGTMGGGSGTADAPAGTPFFICLLSDPRNIVACDATGAGGYTVELSNGTATQTATTDAAGKFFVTPPTGNNFIYKVTGSDIMTSYELYDNAMYIPVIKKAAFLTLQANNSQVTTSGHGDLFARVTHQSAPQGSLGASTTPSTTTQLYDAASTTVWGVGTGTGPFGTVWIPNIGTGLATLTIDLGGGNSHAYLSIPINDGALTFFKAEF